MRTYFDTDSLKVGMMVEYDCSAGLNSCGVTYYLTKVTKTYVEGYSIIGDKRGDIKKITKPKLVRCFPSNQLGIINELKLLLKGQGNIIKINENWEDYETTADILVFCEGIVEGGDCKYCCVSVAFENVLDKYGYECDWENCCVLGIWKKKDNFPSNQLCRHCEEKPILCSEEETKYTCEECGTYDEDEVGISTGANGIEKRVCECCDIDGSNYSGWGEDK
jgi:hypothetical protein